MSNILSRREKQSRVGRLEMQVATLQAAYRKLIETVHEAVASEHNLVKLPSQLERK